MTIGITVDKKEHEAYLTYLIVRLTHSGLKPNFSMTRDRKGHSALSKALDMSNLMAMVPFGQGSPVIPCIISKAMRILSEIKQP